MASSESLLRGMAGGAGCRLVATIAILNTATIIDIGVSVSVPQATHRNQRKAPAVEWMGRIRDRDLFGPSILRPNRGVKKWDRTIPPASTTGSCSASRER